MLIVNQSISIPVSQFDFSFARSSGPGGQNVNKVNSKVTLHWKILKCKQLPETVRDRFVEKYKRRINSLDQLVLSSQRYRDQGRNVADCLEKLRELILSVAEEPKIRKKKRRPARANQRRLNDKKHKSDKKQQRKNISHD